MTPLFYVISAKEIGILQGCCYCTARKEFQRIKDALGLSRSEPLRLRALAKVWDTSPDELAQLLYRRK